MAIKIKQKIVVEDIVDEEGNKLGEIRFNPNDSKITAKMVEIFEELDGAMQKIKELEIKKIDKEKLSSYEDFENVREEFNKVCEGYKLEDEVSSKIIAELSEIFGKETINIFTGGANDAEAILPLIEAIEPYIKEARTKEVSKYMPKDDNVME